MEIISILLIIGKFLLFFCVKGGRKEGRKDIDALLCDRLQPTKEMPFTAI